MVEEYKRNPVN